MVEQILRDLVAFPVLGGESNLSIIRYIQSFLDEHGVQGHLLPNTDGSKASLHCRIGPPTDGGVILSGHTDVVPVVGQDWASDPFVLTDKGDGKLYGRGSCDMKGFLACCLAVLPKMQRAPLKRPIYLAFSYDEEVGCLAGDELAAAFNTFYSEKPQFAIIGEPSLLQPIVGQKGICVLKTTVNGSAGHSSRIRQEVSAIHEAARLIGWLENKMISLSETGARDERFSPPHSSIHVGKFQGGIAPNVIADQATFYWDTRIVPNDSLEQILADFEVYCQERTQALYPVFSDFKIETQQYHPPVPPLGTPNDSPVVDLIKQISPRQDLGTVAYAAEAGQFSNAGFQTVICGPGSIAQAHRADEFIAKSELAGGIKMLEALVQVLSQ